MLTIMANATKRPRTLPDVTRRPQKSPSLKRFEAAIEGLNNFLHGTKNAWATGSLATGPRANKLSSSLSLGDLEISLHRLTLVHAVSLYEYFLKSLLTNTLLARKLPDEGLSLSIYGNCTMEKQSKRWSLMRSRNKQLDLDMQNALQRCERPWESTIRRCRSRAV